MLDMYMIHQKVILLRAFCRQFLQNFKLDNRQRS